MVANAPDQAVYTCQDQTTRVGAIHGVSAGSEKWHYTGDGIMNSGMTTDAAGTVYYGDYGRQSDFTHLHTLDSKGNQPFTLDLKRATVSNIAFGTNRQMFVATSFFNSIILCLGE